MKGSTNGPKVFISYSWSSPKHEQWVIDLAQRLSADGIIVVLDKWDLREGQDKHSFMEQMVSNETIQKVLVVCDAVYQSKANIRKGGVGTESQLISKEVYENISQEKFIPIVTEYDKDGNPCIPHFMSSRIYIDLSSEETFEESYQKLVRNLYNKPVLKRPVVGTPPAYITEDDPVVLKTSHKVAEIKNALANGRPFAKALIIDYYDLFLGSVAAFRLSGGNANDFDEKVVKSIEQMLPLRNDFIEFASIIFKYQDSIDLDSLKEFFEKLYSLQHPTELGIFTELDCDNFKFVCYELMLYVTAILLKLKKYPEASSLINAQYYFRNRRAELASGSIHIFNHYVRSLDDHRKNRLGNSRVSIEADLIKERALRTDITFNDLVSTDLILYYLTSLGTDRYTWFPRLAIFFDPWGNPFDFFQRQVSKQYFEKIKVLYGVPNVDELRVKIRRYSDDVRDGKRRLINDWNYDIPPLESYINPDKIATEK